MVSESLGTEIDSLSQSVSSIVAQCKIVGSQAPVEPELVEELQQLAIALHYTMEALKHKLVLSERT